MEGSQVWTDEERAMLSALIASHESEIAGDESILKVGGGSGSFGSDRLLSEGSGFGKCGVGA